MNKKDCYNLGKITKTQGIKGNVYVFIDADNPEDYSQMESVFVELNNSLVPFFIDFFQFKDGQRALVKFEGVDSEPEAAQIVNCELYLPSAVLPELTEKQFYYHEIPGFKVNDKTTGDIGIVANVLAYSSNPMLEIDFKGSLILLPIRDEFVLSVNRTSKTIEVDCPPGLIDLYLTPQGGSDEREDQ